MIFVDTQRSANGDSSSVITLLLLPDLIAVLLFSVKLHKMR